MTDRDAELRRTLRRLGDAERDWLEAEAEVERIRRRADAAAARADARLRAAEEVRRSRRHDPYALGILDAARLHAGRALAEAARLASAEVREGRLRRRAMSLRAAVAELTGTRPGGARPDPVERGLRCA